MKSFTTNFVMALMIGAAIVTTNTALAGGFSFGGGGGGKGGSSISFGGGKGGSVKFHFDGNNHAPYDFHHHTSCHVPVQRYYVQPVLVYDRCYHPQFRYCFVYPGDTWLTICQRNYGCTYLWKHIAMYNGLPVSAQLVPGQQLAMPVINANGSLAASNAPAPPAFAPQNQQVAAPSQPAHSQATAGESEVPSAAVGATLMFSGESLGSETGLVRLRIGEMALPVEVVEWSDTSVKIQLPKMDLSGAMKAELEVLRADGSLASKSAIQLTPAATRVALGN